jgi:hypothetical protein
VILTACFDDSRKYWNGHDPLFRALSGANVRRIAHDGLDAL